MRQLLTLGQTLIGQSNLTGQQVEAESTEDAAERRDGDETVGGTCLKERGNVISVRQAYKKSLLALGDKLALAKMLMLTVFYIQSVVF